MEKKFTKGNWKTLDKATFDSYQNVWSKALYIDGFNFCMYISGRTEEEVNANAKLISAAPDMLEALTNILKIVEDSEGVVGYHLNGDTAKWDEFDEVTNAIKTIKKATE